jgi:ribonuclease H2 subunit C
MLAFGKSTGDSRQCIPNVLPCRINHNGPVNASERYWLPKEFEGGSASTP